VATAAETETDDRKFLFWREVLVWAGAREGRDSARPRPHQPAGAEAEAGVCRARAAEIATVADQPIAHVDIVAGMISARVAETT